MCCTEHCDADFKSALVGQSIAFSRVNPRQVRELARAMGVIAKTDRVDARVLAQMSPRLDVPVTSSPDPARRLPRSIIAKRRTDS